jgi:Magnesium chelatase, subunit ChlI C-terminal
VVLGLNAKPVPLHAAVAVVIYEHVRAATVAIRPASAAALRPSSSATWARSAGRCWTVSTCTSRCRPWHTKRCAGTRKAPRRATCGNGSPGRRGVQQARGHVNSELPPRLLRKLCWLDDADERTLDLAMRKMGLSARAHDRILKVARTIADLDSSEAVSAKHLAEAVQYRSLDRSYWS